MGILNIITYIPLVGALVPLTGISHDADARRMTLTIDSSGTFTHRRARGETEDAKTGLPDDPVGAPLAPAPAG